MLKKLALLSAGALLLFFLLSSSPNAHADGGAPNLAYVAGTSSGISVIDISQQKIMKTIPLSGDPHAIGLSLDARFLYVSQPAENHFSIVGAKSGQVVCTASVAGNPSLVIVDTNTGLVYVAGNQSPNISVIDGSTCTLKRKLQTEGPVYGLSLAAVGSSLPNSSGSQIWASTPNSVQIFDGNSGKQIDKIALNNPGYSVIPAGTTAYIALRNGGMEAIDLGTHKVQQLIASGKFGPMDYDAATGEIYAPELGTAQIAVLTPFNTGFATPHEPNRLITLKQQPASIAITSDGQLGFVALQGGDVIMYDIPGRQPIETFHVGGNPHNILTGLYPPALGTTPQQASIVTTIIDIAAYIFIVLLFVIPIILFRRFSKTQKEAEKSGKTPVKKGR